MSDHVEHLHDEIVKRAPPHRRDMMNALSLGAVNKGIKDRLMAGTAGYEDIET
jgi:hypothetical protein